MARKRKRIYHVVKADIHHVNRIMELSGKFFAETNFVGYANYAPQKWRGNMISGWSSDRFLTLLAIDTAENRIVGYAHLVREDEYLVDGEWMGFVYQWFIEPEARGIGAARTLRDAVDKQFDEWGCVMDYIESSAGFDDAGKNDKQFFNLWAKIGYQFLGTGLCRRVKRG